MSSVGNEAPIDDYHVPPGAFGRNKSEDLNISAKPTRRARKNRG